MSLPFKITKLTLAVAVALLLASGYAVYGLFDDSANTDTVTENIAQPAPADHNNGDSTTKKTNEATQETVAKPVKQTPTPPENTTDSDAAATVNLNAFYNDSSELVSLRAVLNGATSGTCTASLTKAGGKTITKSVKPTVVTSYYECSFDIPRQQFNSAGNWSAQVRLDYNGTTTYSDVKNVNLP